LPWAGGFGWGWLGLLAAAMYARSDEEP
jgi:hypothetical protein